MTPLYQDSAEKDTKRLEHRTAVTQQTRRPQRVMRHQGNGNYELISQTAEVGTVIAKLPHNQADSQRSLDLKPRRDRL
ncbi:hypothetical protein OAF37_02755 [Rubripirellula sp.]|nr:hypothetical protein [Rubripirellula sp.]MDB4621215.1 hypothetical protein [Rubripirellula sp.]MDB4644958.1 hypothetical protein [Rubripirellula sp.]